MRRQLRSDAEASAFTAEAIGAIADFSGGDPALVNRLARLMLELADDASTKRKEKIYGNGNPANASAADIARNGERKDRKLRTTPDPAPRAIEPNTGAMPDLGPMHISPGGGASPAHSAAECQASMPQNNRRAFWILTIAIVGCVGVGGFAMSNSFGVLQFAQQKVAAFAASDLGLRGNIGLPEKTGAAARIVGELAPEIPARDHLPVETGVAPNAPASEQGTEQQGIPPKLSAQQLPRKYH